MANSAVRAVPAMHVSTHPRTAATPALAAAFNRHAPATASRKYASSSPADLEVLPNIRE